MVGLRIKPPFFKRSLGQSRFREKNQKYTQAKLNSAGKMAKYLWIWPKKSDNSLTDRYNKYISVLLLRKVVRDMQAR
jgi:hypothetical protein